MPAKPKETATESRQRKAQLAVVAIAESDDSAEVKLAELARLRRFIIRSEDQCWVEQERRTEGEIGDDYEVHPIRLELREGVSGE